MPPGAAERIGRLREGESLKLVPDPQNDHDSQAVALRTDADPTLIGYVPRYLARDVWQLFRHCDVQSIHVIVERVNRDAPLQNRLLCRMRACWPTGFEPCSGDDFLPILDHVPARCDR